MTGVENLFIGRGGIIWDWGSNFSKFIDQGNHRVAPYWRTWARYVSRVLFCIFLIGLIFLEVYVLLKPVY